MAMGRKDNDEGVAVRDACPPPRERGPSVLRRGREDRLRSLRRAGARAVLRRQGATEPLSGSVLAVLAGRLLRGHQPRSWHCGASHRLDKLVPIPRPTAGQEPARSLQAVASAAADRRCGATPRVHVDPRGVVTTAGLVKGMDATTREANAEIRSIVPREDAQGDQDYMTALARFRVSRGRCNRTSPNSTASAPRSTLPQRQLLTPWTCN
jgi:hypothetical protein